jgi:hypothetical protein
MSNQHWDFLDMIRNETWNHLDDASFRNQRTFFDFPKRIREQGESFGQLEGRHEEDSSEYST